jgi:hypothetical protein
MRLSTPVSILGTNEFFAKPKEYKDFDPFDSTLDSIDHIEAFAKNKAEWVKARNKNGAVTVPTRSNVMPNEVQTMVSELEEESKAILSHTIATTVQ